MKWFSYNEKQGHSGKCHLILSTDELTEMQVSESLIKITSCEKLSGIETDSKLTSFDKHIKIVCKKASNKLKALARVIPYITIEKNDPFF